jgi:hypothetical protein
VHVTSGVVGSAHGSARVEWSSLRMAIAMDSGELAAGCRRLPKVLGVPALMGGGRGSEARGVAVVWVLGGAASCMGGGSRFCGLPRAHT